MRACPYAASTAALCRLALVPLPQTLSASVKSVPVEQPTPKTVQNALSVLLPMSVTCELPRVVSLSW